MLISEWLLQPDPKSQFGETRLQRITTLVLWNGGLEVTDYGAIVTGKGPLGRQGLDVNEAQELIHFMLTVTGFVLAVPSSSELFDELVKHEAQKQIRAHLGTTPPSMGLEVTATEHAAAD